MLDNVLGYIADHPSHTIYLMIYPTQYFPWEILSRFNSALTLGFQMLFLGGFISYIIAAIIAGLMGGAIGKSFGGWILTIIVSIVLFIAIITIDDFNLNYISFTATLVDGIVIVVIA
ncbi:hypothetical protein LCGC14_0997210, partial [marine sediment metagenome]